VVSIANLQIYFQFFVFSSEVIPVSIAEEKISIQIFKDRGAGVDL
jgi:hypothetical protein